MSTLKHIVIIICIYSTGVCAKDKLNTHYDYIFDNSGFSAHQIENTLKTQYGDIYHNYYDAIDNGAQYSYNHVNITTSMVGDNWSIVLGPGIIASDQGNFNPSYKFIADYQPDRNSNIELYADRTPIMSNSGDDSSPILKIADYVSDNITLSGEYQLIEELNISGGILTREYSDGNQQQGVFAKIHYQIDDNWGVQYRNKVLFNDYTSVEYFSPREFHRNWLLLTYNRDIIDGVAFKIAGGPGITKIDDRTEGTWIVEAKIIGKFSKDVNIETHVNCVS